MNDFPDLRPAMMKHSRNGRTDRTNFSKPQQPFINSRSLCVPIRRPKRYLRNVRQFSQVSGDLKRLPSASGLEIASIIFNFTIFLDKYALRADLSHFQRSSLALPCIKGHSFRKVGVLRARGRFFTMAAPHIGRSFRNQLRKLRNYFRMDLDAFFRRPQFIAEARSVRQIPNSEVQINLAAEFRKRNLQDLARSFLDLTD